MIASVFMSCNELTPVDQDKDPVVVLPEGAVLLEDAGFGMYYGDKNYDGIGVYSVVLSDARCYMDGLDNPYMDSEGDMLVLSLRSKVLEKDAAIELPAGDYKVSKDASDSTTTIDASESYLARFVGNSQSVWKIDSGNISFKKGNDGVYTITTSDLAVSKGEQKDTLSYACRGALKLDDYYMVAPSLITTEEDIVDLPFSDIECIYYGDLYESGTGNFLLNMSTKGFLQDETGTLPGVYITLNFFSRLYPSGRTPKIEEGSYRVSAISNAELFTQWTLLPGIYMDGTPFGSYLLQQVSDGDNTVQYITKGSIDVKYETVGDVEYTIFTYSLGTATRKIKGMWRGVLPVDNQAPETGDSYLTTLEGDVECDMTKVENKGTLAFVETLHRDNVLEHYDYDIAEAWRLTLQPRDWTGAEKEIPWTDPDNPDGPDGIKGTEDDWMYDKNNNGIRDRLEAWCADGDVMLLEFVLPLDSEGIIAPEKNVTYTYTLQPNLSLDDKNYDLYASKMGKPEDEIFDAQYAEQYPAYVAPLGIENYEYSLSRRGFTWSEDGFRGNWYLHYEEGRHFILDGHAPAVNGTVKVTRVSDYSGEGNAKVASYNIEWDFIDDLPGTPNKITGKIDGCKVGIQPKQ